MNQVDQPDMTEIQLKLWSDFKTSMMKFILVLTPVFALPQGGLFGGVNDDGSPCYFGNCWYDHSEVLHGYGYTGAPAWSDDGSMVAGIEVTYQRKLKFPTIDTGIWTTRNDRYRIFIQNLGDLTKTYVNELTPGNVDSSSLMFQKQAGYILYNEYSSGPLGFQLVRLSLKGVRTEINDNNYGDNSGYPKPIYVPSPDGSLLARVYCPDRAPVNGNWIDFLPVPCDVKLLDAQSLVVKTSSKFDLQYNTKLGDQFNLLGIYIHRWTSLGNLVVSDGNKTSFSVTPSGVATSAPLDTCFGLSSKSGRVNSNGDLLDLDMFGSIAIAERNKMSVEIDEELGIQMEAFQEDKAHLAGFILLSLVSLSILPIMCYWRPEYYCWIACVKTTNLDAAIILVKEKDYALCRVHQGQIRYFEYKNKRFVYSDSYKYYKRTDAILKDLKPEYIHSLVKGNSSNTCRTELLLNGKNRIYIKDTPIIQMILEKCIHPFYIFQMASVIIWFVEGYATYSYLILSMSIASILWEVWTAKDNENKLRKLTEHSAQYKVLRDNYVQSVNSEDLVIGDVLLLENKDMEAQIPCDLILVHGECLTDESSLTGETVPILKIPLQPFGDPVNIDKDKNHILFGGSNILQLKPKKFNDTDCVMAIVMSTGFYTSKGKLFDTILNPHEIDFKFNRDASKFMSVLGVVAFLAFLNRAVNSFMEGMNWFDALIDSVDLITIAVPPALPLILTVGIGISVQRLAKLKIFCIDPARLNFAGRLDIMCWDKTGTLTVSSLSFIGVDRQSAFGTLQDDVGFSNMNDDNALEKFMLVCHGVTVQNGTFLGHSLDIEMFTKTGWVMKESAHETVKIGNDTYPLVIELESQDSPKSNILILKRFGFDAHLQRSSVISYHTSMVLHTKGSPEAIRAICVPESIPGNYDQLVSQYSIEGYYVIACASKRISIECSQFKLVKRDDVEHTLQFCGFLLFQNPLKEQTYDTFTSLKEANIRPVIITGDNALTAIHVARQLDLCKHAMLIDTNSSSVYYHEVPSERKVKSGDIHSHSTVKQDVNYIPSLMEDSPHIEFCMTGKALKTLIANKEDDLLAKLIPKVRIFSRTKPDQKTFIVEYLIQKKFYVGMCGDGTNDCGALKAAHVGLALSSAEASIVAPFTSADKKIEDIVELVKEGRCALETSFMAFKYMTLYPIIQLMMAATLNQIGGGLSNNQFLFDDMCIVTMLALLSLYTRPNDTLSTTKPTDNLLDPHVISSIIGQIAICILFFTINLTSLVNQPWFCSITTATSFLDDRYQPVNATLGAQNYPCYPISPDIDVNSSQLITGYENASVWLYTHFQFAVVIFSLCLITKYRKPFWTNWQFTWYWGFIMIVMAYLLVGVNNPSTAVLPTDVEYANWISYLFLLPAKYPASFRIYELFLTIIYFFCSTLWEVLLEWKFNRHFSLMSNVKGSQKKQDEFQMLPV
ncbi:hypothetical protein HDV06_005984 [Boothiomyces sp. JEL0866]|nr:hypothetical protein HDV06_005984 [Boothiomyces sp. JEL0866]